jgi:hypothetical protein
MKYFIFALMLMATPASADDLYSLYAGGKYEEAMRDGAAANNAYGYAIAARAALADAAMRPKPCLDCLRRGEDFARRAVAADAKQADGHVWLAAALGLEGRIIGMIRARLADMPHDAYLHLITALQHDPRNAYALAAMGAWNIEIVKAGGAFLARKIYGVTEEDGMAFLDRAVKSAPGNVAVRYQIGLLLAGYQPDLFRARITAELEAAIHDTPNTAYEKFIQGRAAELLALQKQNDPELFAARVREFQGYPD